jgi:cobalamin biosynthetic protein CobC
MPDSVFRDLPNDDDDLQQVACDYYGSDQVLMVPGSSWAIQYLPTVLNNLVMPINKVLLPQLGYSEHKRAWRALGAQIEFYDDLPSVTQLQTCQVCVLINPNNPSTHLVSEEGVVKIAQQLQQQSAWLIVDEAFIDSRPHNSVVHNRGENVIVLRSLGKFFGLAGLRVGAIIANDEVLHVSKEMLNPWALNHPARFIAKKALQDKQWIKYTQADLKKQSQTLLATCEQSLLKHLKIPVTINQTDFFVTLLLDRKMESLTLHHCLCMQGIYTRLLDNQKGIRIGLPNNSGERWQQLEHGFIQAAYNFKKDIFNAYT